MRFTIVFHPHPHHHNPHHHNPHHHHHHNPHHHHHRLSPMISVLLLLLLLPVPACHADAVQGRDDAGDDVRQRDGLSELVGGQRVEGVLHGGTGRRHQRQGEDLGSNTPAAKDTTASDSDEGASRKGKDQLGDSPGHRHKRRGFDFSMNTPPPEGNSSASDDNASRGGLSDLFGSLQNNNNASNPFSAGLGDGGKPANNDSAPPSVLDIIFDLLGNGSEPELTSGGQDNSSDNSTTLRPLRERRCIGTECVHGYCNASACWCDLGWDGFFCQFPCFRNCSNGGNCRYFLDTQEQKCLCLKPWTGANCSEREPGPHQDNSLVHWLTGSFAVGLVLVITCGAVFMFYLWRKRLVFALKVVYYFLPYEDNDGRQYDAFVSYALADADEAFVYTHLRPKVETEMGFNLCLHQRDFPVGGVMSDHILDALENSRRFILILTPNYLRNEWAEFEFQRAFHEMLKRKLRIIPILVEDISQCQEDWLNPTLKTIMDSVALLTFPGTAEQDDPKSRKFWKQLKLCMPKRKKNDDDDGGRNAAQAVTRVGIGCRPAVVGPADDDNTDANDDDDNNTFVGHYYYELNGGHRVGAAEANAVELCVCDGGREDTRGGRGGRGRHDDRLEPLTG